MRHFLRSLGVIITALAVLTPVTVSARRVIAYVNSACTSDYSGAVPTTSPATSATSLTAGNVNVVAFTAHDDVSNNILATSLSDTAGNTTGYVLETSVRVGIGRTQLAYVENAAGNGSNVVTVTTSNATANWTICTMQFSGVATSGAKDAEATGTQGFGTTVSTGSFSTDTADEAVAVFIRAQQTDYAITTPASGYTARASAAKGYLYSAVLSSTYSGVVTGTGTIDETTISLLTFRIGGGGGATFQFGILPNNPTRGGGRVRW